MLMGQQSLFQEAEVAEVAEQELLGLNGLRASLASQTRDVPVEKGAWITSAPGRAAGRLCPAWDQQVTGEG